MNRSPKFRLAAVAITAFTVLAACSDDDSKDSSPATEAPAPTESMAPETTMAPGTTEAELGTIVDVAAAAGGRRFDGGGGGAGNLHPWLSARRRES